MSWMSTQFKQSLDALFTNSCVLCDCSVHGPLPLCPPCKQELPWQRGCCPRCALPLAHPAAVCGPCLKHPPSFERCIAPFRYDAPIDRLIGRFKNQRSLLHGNLLVTSLAEYVSEHTMPAEMPDFICYVPLHWRRQLRRGFNQSAYLALALSTRFGIPLQKSSRRLKATPKQQQLNRQQRLRNLSDAFQVDSDMVGGRHLVLVDDVVTTQATAEALSALYRQAGAARVDVWALARTPAPTSQ